MTTHAVGNLKTLNLTGTCTLILRINIPFFFYARLTFHYEKDELRQAECVQESERSWTCRKVLTD